MLFRVAGELGHFDGICFKDLVYYVVVVCTLVDKGDLVSSSIECGRTMY